VAGPDPAKKWDSLIVIFFGRPKKSCSKARLLSTWFCKTLTSREDFEEMIAKKPGKRGVRGNDLEERAQTS
jgi:hypothetical protein